MLPVCMGSNEDLVTGDLFRQLQGNLMRLFRGDGIIGAEGLHHVVVHSSVRASMLPLGIHEFQ